MENASSRATNKILPRVAGGLVSGAVSCGPMWPMYGSLTAGMANLGISSAGVRLKYLNRHRLCVHTHLNRRIYPVYSAYTSLLIKAQAMRTHPPQSYVVVDWFVVGRKLDDLDLAAGILVPQPRH